jgi:hypothetical protein
MHEGDDLVITDTTCPNQLKVRQQSLLVSLCHVRLSFPICCHFLCVLVMRFLQYFLADWINYTLGGILTKRQDSSVTFACCSKLTFQFPEFVVRLRMSVTFLAGGTPSQATGSSVIRSRHITVTCS